MHLVRAIECDGDGDGSEMAATPICVLKRGAPRSVAVVGWAGGNGFDEAVGAGVTRPIGIDINERCLADARGR